MAGSLQILQAQEPPGSTCRLRPGEHPQNLFEERLVAWDGQRSRLVGEAVLLLGLHQQLLEDGVVQVRCAHDEPSAVAADADGDVSCGDVGRGGGFEVRLLVPAL